MLSLNLCDEFSDIFKEELGCIKNFELKEKFKSNTKPVFHKARSVPFVLWDVPARGYKEGISKIVKSKSNSANLGSS